jgi:ParB-like nuclease domain
LSESDYVAIVAILVRSTAPSFAGKPHARPAAGGVLILCMAEQLLQLDEATRRLRPFARHYAGVRPIPVRSIVGTEGRAADFDRRFEARRADVRERRRRVEEAFPDGAFPPIVVHQLGDAYFVVDGHHRVAVARRRGIEMIDAEVTQLTSRWRLDVNADSADLIHAQQELMFMTESGLLDVRPDVLFTFSEAVGYRQLLETIQVHGYQLMLEEGRRLSRGDVARDWYGRVYLPAVDVIYAERFEGVCPNATDSDKFLWLYERRRELAVADGEQRLDEVARQAIRAAVPERRGLRRLVRATQWAFLR